MAEKQQIHCLSKGSGSLKHYKYWTGGIKLTTKRAIMEAIGLKLRLLRKDKITSKIELFDYKKLNFGEVKK